MANRYLYRMGASEVSSEDQGMCNEKLPSTYGHHLNLKLFKLFIYHNVHILSESLTHLLSYDIIQGCLLYTSY